ncbi:type II toxin-antitoxin system YafQ family toxin [Bifidobacterium fermentum]|jgi:mRNA interferase YafQ|uniref:Type II toxin-antitoxin system YafQ family toxin n=1 Tax=Bifidobacterium fermentum TaxID=3059035 RepID=A0AB39UCH0_9BIFI
MLNISYQPSFVRQIKRLKRKHYDMQKLVSAVRAVAEQKQDLLRTRYRDHALQGQLRGFRELHIEADRLLVYRIEHDTLTLMLIETGSHNDLFG